MWRTTKGPQRPQQSAKSAVASPQHRKLQEALLCTKLSQQSTKFASCSIQACTTSISLNGISTSPTLIVRTQTLGSRNLKAASNSLLLSPSWMPPIERNKLCPHPFPYCKTPHHLRRSQNSFAGYQKKSSQPFTFMSPAWKPKRTEPGNAGGASVRLFRYM